ncbi:MAG: mandelate racemase/muconate lactonizing enzyme family protein [Chloroflexota bacterium]
MKITKVEAFNCDAGWRPWTFVKIETDTGITGWGECSDGRHPLGVAHSVRDFTHLLIGKDPRPVELLYWDMIRTARQNPLGVSHKAIAGIELALWDIKARALGVPVYELFGGPTRDRMRLYWSHCGTTRARHAAELGLPELRSMDDIKKLGAEVKSRGFTALKTNIVFPGNPARVYFAGFDAGPNTTDGTVTPEILDHIETQIAAFSEGAGPNIQIALDLNYNFRFEAAVKIARRLEKFNMQWIEYDTWEPGSLRSLKESTTNTIASLESVIGARQYKPFLDLRATDVAIIDVPWNGFGESVRIGRLAELYDVTVAPHNYYSHLADLHSIQLCAVLPNVRVMEIDIDDVPWKQTLVTNPPRIENGHIYLPTGPGWGTDINEDVLRAHPWPKQ